MHAPLNGPHPRPTPAPDPGHPLGVGPLAIVGGCGHVGLPLGLAFARKGYAVDLLDVSPERAALINSGKMPFHEEGADALLSETVRSGLVKATTDPAVLEDAAAIIVTIGTPVDEYLDPSVVEFDRSMNELLDRVHPGQAARVAKHALPRRDRPAGPPRSWSRLRRSGATWTWPTARSASCRGSRSASWNSCRSSVAGTTTRGRRSGRRTYFG